VIFTSVLIHEESEMARVFPDYSACLWTTSRCDVNGCYADD